MNKNSSSISNVQLTELQTGQVNNQGNTVGEIVSDIVSEAVSQPTAGEQEREQRRAELAALRIMTGTEVPPEEPALSVDGVGFFALDDIHAVKAKQKAGKTSALKVCVAALLGGSQFRVKAELEEPRVLYLDTEQKQADTKLIVTDVRRMTGMDDAAIDSRLFVYGLRRRNFDQLLDDLRLLIGECRPQVVIIDGIVEFIASFNDESQSKQLIHELLLTAENHHCAVVCVLHTNKADEDHNMRGHLGTMLAQKAGTVLECRKQGGVISVSCADARHAEMPEWSIMFDDDGHIIDADERRQQQLEQHKAELQQRRQEAAAEKQKERLDYALLCIRDHGGSISRRQLTEILMKKFELKRTTVTTFISRHVGSSFFEANGIIQASPDMALAF